MWRSDRWLRDMKTSGWQYGLGPALSLGILCILASITLYLIVLGNRSPALGGCALATGFCGATTGALIVKKMARRH